MANGFTEDVTITTVLAGGNTSGNASAIINVPYRHGWILGVYAELSSGDATDFGIQFYSRKNGANYYTTETNIYKLHDVASAARTGYNDGDANFAFLAENAGSTTGGRRLSIAVNLDFSGASANSTVVYKVRVIGLGVG